MRRRLLPEGAGSWFCSGPSRDDWGDIVLKPWRHAETSVVHGESEGKKPANNAKGTCGLSSFGPLSENGINSLSLTLSWLVDLLIKYNIVS